MDEEPHRLLKVKYRAPYSERWEERPLEWAMDRIAERIKQTRDESFVHKMPGGPTVNHTLALAELRDRAIERLRRDQDSSPATQDDLERINSALSMIIGLEYPITGIRRDTLADLRNTLAGLSKSAS